MTSSTGCVRDSLRSNAATASNSSKRAVAGCASAALDVLPGEEPGERAARSCTASFERAVECGDVAKCGG